MVSKYCLWSPIKCSLSSSGQAPRPTLQKPKKADQGNWPAPEVVKIGTCYFLNPLKTETNPAPLHLDIFSGPSSVRRQRQNPCTLAHGSPKTKPGIFFSPTGHTLVFRQPQRPGRSRTRLTKTKNPSRPSRLRGEKFTSNLSHYAPKHRNFHAKFFQKFLPTAL